MLTIGEVAERVGLRTSALRYYEDEGLLEPAARVGGQRRYEEDAVDRLVVIQFCRRLGFTLAEIRDLLADTDKRRWRRSIRRSRRRARCGRSFASAATATASTSPSARDAAQAAVRLRRDFARRDPS